MKDKQYHSIWIEFRDGSENGRFSWDGNVRFSTNEARTYIEQWDKIYPHQKHEIREVSPS
jgi:hypothetical protein